MPTLYRAANWKITMYFGDHHPPHFHIVMKDGREALMALDGFEVMEGAVSDATLKSARKWAAANVSLLAETWARMQQAR